VVAAAAAAAGSSKHSEAGRQQARQGTAGGQRSEVQIDGCRRLCAVAASSNRQAQTTDNRQAASRTARQ
jgi:hypothetical protein